MFALARPPGVYQIDGLVHGLDVELGERGENGREGGPQSLVFDDQQSDLVALGEGGRGPRGGGLVGVGRELAREGVDGLSDGHERGGGDRIHYCFQKASLWLL